MTGRYTIDHMELAQFVGSGYTRLTESEKIRRGLYPDFDEEVLSRKIRKVCGFLKGGMNITDSQWREVMVECWKEYKVLGRKPTRKSRPPTIREGKDWTPPDAKLFGNGETPISALVNLSALIAKQAAQEESPAEAEPSEIASKEEIP